MTILRRSFYDRTSEAHRQFLEEDRRERRRTNRRRLGIVVAGLVPLSVLVAVLPGLPAALWIVVHALATAIGISVMAVVCVILVAECFDL